MTHLIPMKRGLGSAVYILLPSNLKSSHDIGSGGSCLAAVPVCVCVREKEREKVLQLVTIECGEGIRRKSLNFIKLNVFINS